MNLSKIIPEKHKFAIYTYLLAGFLLVCFSFGICLFLCDANLDFFVKYLLGSYLLAFPITFFVVLKRKK